MKFLAATIIVVFALFLLAFTVAAYAKPELAIRFLMLFGRSARAHFIEQMIRLLVGAALVILSPEMWQSTLFWLIGWGVVISSVALMCTPWRWHHRLAERLVPPIVRHLRLCTLGPLVFGVMLLYGVFAGPGT